MADVAEGEFLSDQDGLKLHYFDFGQPVGRCKALIQIAHGLGEHSLRYARFAAALREHGYWVFGMDHRGHGRSVDAERPLGRFGAVGLEGMWHDMIQFGRLLHDRQPDLPVVLVGHSMGSMAAQSVIAEGGHPFAAIVLLGTTDLKRYFELAEETGDADPLETMNVKFGAPGGLEFLTRDDDEVAKFVADPLCGMDTPEDISKQLADSAQFAYDPRRLSSVDPDLHVLIASGGDDSINCGDKNLVELVAQRLLFVAGVTDVEVRIYPGARHELVNELNRDQFTNDFVDWLGARFSFEHVRGA